MPARFSQPDPKELRIGRYRVTAELARGRISRVFKAEDTETHQPVAVKLSGLNLSDPAEAARWLDRETAGLSRLKHPNIARILDGGVTPDQQPYLVMEYIEGVSLDRLIRRKPPPSFSVMLDLAIQICRGLQAAARRNIVHLDIKPANLMLESATGTLKIVDFGLARQLWKPLSPASDSVASASQSGGAFGGRAPAYPIEGTPRYMSPEQCRGIGADHRSDIYSAGATFYHLFASQPPFESAKDGDLIEKRPFLRLIPLHEIHPGIPSEVCDIIERMMASDPNDRYQDYETLLVDLEAAKLAQIAREKKTDKPVAGVAETEALPTTAGGWRWVQQHPFLFAFAGILLILLLASLMFRPLNEEGDDEELGPVGSAIKNILIPEDTPETAAARKNRLRMRLLARAAKRYLEDNGTPPASVSDLVRRGLVSRDSLLDAWDHPLMLIPERAAILSLGEDGLPGTGDEWEISWDGRFTRFPGDAGPPDAQEDEQMETGL